MKFSRLDNVKDFRSFIWYYYYQYYFIFCKPIHLCLCSSTQYYYNTNENNSSLLNELKTIKTILEIKVTKLATALQITSSLPQILQPPNINLIDSKINGIPQDSDIEKRKIAENTFGTI